MTDLNRVRTGVSDDESDRVQEARTIITSHILPKIATFHSLSVQDHFVELASYVRERLPGVTASEPIIHRMLQALSEGPFASTLYAVQN